MYTQHLLETSIPTCKAVTEDIPYPLKFFIVKFYTLKFIR